MINKVIAIAPFPPPINGASKNSNKICDNLYEMGCDVRRVNSGIAKRTNTKSVGYHTRRVLNCVRNCARLCRTIQKTDTIYTVPSGGWGLLYDLVYTAVLRLRGHKGRVFFHHRNFKNIAKRSRMLGLLSSLAGRRGTHVFLEKRQVSLFEKSYGVTVRNHVVRNAALCDVGASKWLVAHEPLRPVTVGYLSNLSDGKGFDVVERVFLEAAAASEDLTFVLAGETTDKNADGRLERLRYGLGPRLCYYGHVGGEEKTEFFRSVDIFLFPTRYWPESQPNVIYEAMAAGAIVVASRWACIPFMMDEAPHHIVDCGSVTEMAKQIIANIEFEISDITRLWERRQGVLSEFKRIQTDAWQAYQDFLSDVDDGQSSRSDRSPGNAEAIQ